ncbi:MAG: two-component system sensor histidine kinase CreC [Holophaga sp.]|nr:two-component system sensor histidine kinase CreC [Holophaga sp.]
MKLSVRVFLGFFLIVGVAAYFVLRIFMQEVKPGVRQGMEVALVDSAQLLAEVAAPELAAGRLTEGTFAQAVARYTQRESKARIWGMEKHDPQFEVYVTDTQGRVVFDSEGRAVGQDYSRWNDVLLTLRGQYGVRSTRAIPGDESSSRMFVAAPVLQGDRLLGVLTVSTPTASVIPFAQRSQRRVFHAGLVLMGAALLTGLLLSWWLTRSLNRLRAYARQVAEGHKAMLPAVGGGELAELGRALEWMREKLEGRKYLERYVQALTHEMKSPLAAIHGAAELLDEALPEPERRRFVANIRDQELRLRLLVDRMLGLASLQQRQGLQAAKELSLLEIVEVVVASKTVRSAQNNLQIRIHPPSDAKVRGEAFLLELALSNLLDNAIDFSPTGGLIEVEMTTTGNRIALVVKDQGSGIPEFAATRIFEPFYSLPRPATHKKSTGLGLSFVREVAELHGGSIEVSNRPDEGVEACLMLPLA